MKEPDLHKTPLYANSLHTATLTQNQHGVRNGDK